MNKKSLQILGILLLGCLSMSFIDGVLHPAYFTKSMIKLVFFLLVPILFVLKEKDIKNLMRDIQTYGELFKADVSTIYALQLAPYVFLRPFNLRHLEWKEINFEKEYLEIDGSKMKTGKDFVLPLCKTALNILETMKPFSYNSTQIAS